MSAFDDNSRKACIDRRNQVLDAASECFRQHGFHGASIAVISKSAGMSAGHIYHYFENKEAIIAAIVDRDLAEVMGVFERLQSAEDVLHALLNCANESLEAKLDRKRSALKMEVLAEAGRNSKVAEMLHRIDRIASAKFCEVLKTARRDLPPLSDAELSARGEVLGALFNGLMVRGLTNPDLDRNALVAALQPALRALIAE